MSTTRHHVLGTAGHIDHGKTALLRALTGVDTDRLPEEKKRGITIDLGFAALELGSDRLAIVDVPGHERFLRNMLAGATGLDFALLVVAADDSVMPQTREHLEILQLLGLERGVIAITKADLVDEDWIALVVDEVRRLVAGTFLAGAPIVVTSSQTGRGIDDLRRELASLCASAPARPETGLFRLAIDRSFTIAGHGTVVTGTVASGSVAVGDALEIRPGGRAVRVRALHRHDRAVDRIDRGCRAAINLVGVHHTEVGRGDLLAAPGYLGESTRLSVEIRPTADAPRPLRERVRYRIHLGTAEVTGRIVFARGAEGSEELLDPGAPRLAQLVLLEPTPSVYGQPFVIREESPAATVGGGRVLEPDAPRLRRKDAAALARLERLRSPDPLERLAAALEAIGLSEWTEAELIRRTAIAVDDLAPALARLHEQGRLIDVAIGARRATRVSAGAIEALERRILTTLRRLHAASPRLASIPRPRLITALADLDHDGLVQALIDRLAARGAIAGDGKRISIRGHEPKLSKSERRLLAEIAAAYKGTRFTPPDIETWSKRPGTDAAMVGEIFSLLRDEDVLRHLGGGLHVEAEAATELHELVIARLSDGSTMTMADLRDLLGTSRKYAVPIGEYLDRAGLTVREGDVRRLAKPAPDPQPEGARS